MAREFSIDSRLTSFSRLMAVGIFLCLMGTSAYGQTDQDINQVRDRDNIPSTDQQNIERWLGNKLAAIANSDDISAAYAAFNGEFTDSRNSSAFNSALASALSKVAEPKLAAADLDESTAFVLGRQLASLRAIETVPALTSGLKSKSSMVRYYMARGLFGLRQQISADDAAFTRTVTALAMPAKVETDSVVLSHLYRALQYSNKVSDILPAYLQILDGRLDARRQMSGKIDGAEIEVVEFFRQGSVLSQLNQTQQIELVQRLAVWFRMAGERYNDNQLAPPNNGVNMRFRESDSIERLLVGIEDCLTQLINGKSADVASELASGGWTRRAAVLNAVLAWVGDTATNQSGTLNAAPWNIAVGAP